MKSFTSTVKLIPALLLALGAWSGCESTDGGSTHVSSGVYYGSGFSDPWYHGEYHDDADIIVTPPPSRPERPMGPPRPSHPIARPPGGGGGMQPRPMPSIPSAPRVSSRR